MKKIILLVVILLIPIVYGLEGNFFATAGSGNITGNISGNFYQVSGIIVGQSSKYILFLDSINLTINYPANASIIARHSPIVIRVLYSSSSGANGIVTIYNNTNKAILCYNASVPSNSEMECSIKMFYGEELFWGVNATILTVKKDASIFSFLVRAIRETGYLFFLILLPILFGLLLLIGTITLGRDHEILKFIGLPISFISVIVSMNFAVVTINDENPSLIELVNALGNTTAWIGRFLVLLFAYLLIYMLKTYIDYLNDKKERDLNY